MKNLKISLVLILFTQVAFGQFNSVSDIRKALLQSDYWDVVDENSISKSNERLIVPNKYVALKLDVNRLKSVLSNTVLRTNNDFSQGVQIDIPTPIGIASKFLAFKNTTMSPGLETKFSEIRSYDVVAVNDPSIKGKIDITPHGFHAMIFTVGKGSYFVDPYAKGDLSNYVIYNKKDFETTKQMNCGVDSQSDFLLNKLNSGGDKVLGSCDLRTYRLALAATGEYTTFHGGTVALGLAAQVTSMNRVNGMFERDAQITMTIVPNNNLLVYTNGGTDPYTNGSGGAMLGENQTNIDALIGTANYDIGHVYSTGGGGIASLQSPCSAAFKARGVTGQGAPVGDPFDIDYVAHEMGHQFGGNHTQNNSCNRNNATAVEPGSASSIMGYAGICAPNVQNNSDDHFHGISVAEMSAFISGAGGGCAVTTATVNSSPSITGTNGNITIPGGTPFALTATATDPNAANVLSYCWEQMDNQATTQPPVSTATGGPNFRSISPSTNSTRYFPNLTDLMAGGPFTWEVLSTVNRTMNFRVTVRDNAGPLPEVSCSDIQDVTVTVDASSGPFVETFPSAAGIIWTGATSETITWNEAGTATGAVSCANVDILLSTDGGLTYPTILASNVPNTGSGVITVPNISTSTAVVMIVCSNGTFFDISDNVFTINAGVPPPPPAASACLDTVFYPESKRTGFSAYQLISQTGNFLSGFSQTYNSNTGTIHGVNAYVLLDTNGIIGDAPSKDVYIKVFNVDAMNRPVGAAIDSNLVTLTDVGTARQTLMFATPVAVTNRYAIAIALNPVTAVSNNDTIWFRGNDDLAVLADGLGEGLLGLNLNFPGFGWTNFLLQFGTGDYDALIAPIFDKTIGSTYTTDVDTLCLGDDVVFTNTATLDTNYMYNRWDSLNTDPWIWNYGDGTGTYNHYDTTYAFVAAGTFTTELLVTNYGYTNNCTDLVQKDIEVVGANVQVNNDTIVCTGTPVNLAATGSATTYTWDNGLGVGQNHTLTPTIDTLYTVTASTTSGTFNCTSTDSVFVALAACACVDTVFYPQSKMTSLSSFLLMSEVGNGQKGVAQTYEANTGTIHGINAFVLLDTNGIVGDASPLDVVITVSNVDPVLNKPTTVIATNIVTLADVGTNSQTLFFDAPVAVTGRYAVTVELNPVTAVPNADTLWFLTNNSLAVPPDGQAQGLMAFDLAFGFGWTNFLLEFGVTDADVLLAPIFDKAIGSSYTTDVDTLCLGGDVVFTNTATLDTNYMYNRWDSLNMDPWIWNYGDGTGTYNHYDTTYTFGLAGTFTTELLVTNYGYTNNCVDLVQKDIEVVGAIVQANNDTIVCTGTPVNLAATGSATTYTWDNGLGAGQNHTITPTIDTLYTVTALTTSGTFNCTSKDSVFVALAACACVDTIFYPQSKMTGLSSFELISEIGNGIKGVSQTYNSNTGTIHGIDALILLDINGIAGDAAPLDVYIKVTNVDGLNRPTTTIDSALVTLIDVGTKSQTLFFDAPVAVAGPYAVTVELNPVTAVPNGDTLWFLTNDKNAVPPDGQGEGLYALDLAFGFGWTNFFLQFINSPDVDALLSPIFDKTIAATYTTDVDSVCLGGDVVFTNTATLDTNYMYNRWDSLNTDPWVWNYGDGTGTYNHYDTTYTYGSAGTFTTQLLITNYGYTNNCVDSIQKDIEVLETIVATSADTAICLGDTVFLSATGAISYIWDNGLGAGQNQDTTIGIDTMFVVTGTGVFNCVGTDTVNVTINSLPTILASNDTIVCSADTVFLSATGGDTYAWDNGLGAGQNQTAFTSIDTMYIVTGTDLLGCRGLDTVHVAVLALPVVTASNDTTICNRDTASISATSIETVFTWDNGLGLGQSHVVSPSTDTSYVVSVSDLNNCVGRDTVQITIDGFTIIANNDTTICIGTEATLSVNGGSIYNWDNGLGAGELHVVSPEVTTTYIVTSDENGCIDTDTVVVTLDNMCFEVPNVFTPNGDGTNDVWIIHGLETYPDVTVKVFNRWGDSVFESNAGYTEPWDGTYSGSDSPSATYYYIIVLGGGEEGISGTINIVR